MTSTFLSLSLSVSDTWPLVPYLMRATSNGRSTQDSDHHSSLSIRDRPFFSRTINSILMTILFTYWAELVRDRKLMIYLPLFSIGSKVKRCQVDCLHWFAFVNDKKSILLPEQMLDHWEEKISIPSRRTVLLCSKCHHRSLSLSHDFLTILRNHLMHALIRFALSLQMTHGFGFTPNNQRKYFIAQSRLRYINTYTYRRIHCSEGYCLSISHGKINVFFFDMNEKGHLFFFLLLRRWLSLLVARSKRMNSLFFLSFLFLCSLQKFVPICRCSLFRLPSSIGAIIVLFSFFQFNSPVSLALLWSRLVLSFFRSILPME